jgi:hypothetical protein
MFSALNSTYNYDDMLILNVNSVSNISFVNTYPYAGMGTVLTPTNGANTTAVAAGATSLSTAGLSQCATIGIAVACAAVVRYVIYNLLLFNCSF